MHAVRTMVVAELRFDAFVTAAKSSSVPELHRLATTMTKWRTQILQITAPAHRTGPPRP